MDQHSDAGSSRSGCSSNMKISNRQVQECTTDSNSRSSLFPPTGTIDLSSLVTENQSIKLVPSVEEVVRNNGFAFDPNLDENTKDWLKQLQNKYNLWKKGSNVVQMLHTYFESVTDPFSTVLRLVINCPGFSDSKPNTLPYQIVNELKVWSQPKNELKVLLTPDLKFTAFNIAKEQKNSSFLKLVVNVYEVIHENEKILPHIKIMLEAGKYKAAHQSIIALDLHNMLDVKDLLIPLVLQDKLNLVDEYLVKCPEQAMILVSFLDQLLIKNESIRTKIDNFLDDRQVPDIRWEKFYHKPIGKLISRLCNTYNIPIRGCKNLNRHRIIGGIRFLIHQKYIDNVISDNAWNDLVIDTITDNPDLVKELVNLVDEYDTKEAFKWAVHFKLAEDLYPESFKTFDEKHNATINPESEVENWDAVPSTSKNVGYFVLSLPRSKIIFVDDLESFKSALIDGLSGVLLIGIDSEWKPSFGAKPSSVSLIQIATKWETYLFDVLALGGSEYLKLWTTLAEKIFDNQNVIKIGFGLENDIREIRGSVPGLNTLKCKGPSYLELATLWKAVLKAGIKMPYQKLNVGEGLSSIVEQCFGLALKKHEQCSNWENRPLRPSQIEYAALDAYVLLEIHEFLQMRCVESKLNFDDICYKIMIDFAQAKIKKGRKKYPKGKFHFYATQGPNKNCVEAKTVKLMLENCLGSLASCLRSCGIDILLYHENENWDQFIQTACKENRYMVTSNTTDKKVIKNIMYKFGHILHSNNISEQLKEVFRYFNINKSTVELYSRCYLCNSSDLVDISQDVMREMFKQKSKCFTDKNVNVTNIKHTSSININNHVNESYQSSSHNHVPQCHVNNEFNVDGFTSYNDDQDESNALSCLHWHLTPGESIFVDKCCTRSGVPIKLKAITNAVIDENTSFRICQTCGNCYWDGNYLPEPLDNVINKLLTI